MIKVALEIDDWNWRLTHFPLSPFPSSPPSPPTHPLLSCFYNRWFDVYYYFFPPFTSMKYLIELRHPNRWLATAKWKPVLRVHDPINRPSRTRSLPNPAARSSQFQRSIPATNELFINKDKTKAMQVAMTLKWQGKSVQIRHTGPFRPRSIFRPVSVWTYSPYGFIK